MDEFRARWVVPGDAPPIEGGRICVEGGIIRGVSSGRDARSDRVVDLGDVVLLPGFVNAHCHLEATGFRGFVPRAPLWPWLDEMMKLRYAPGAAEIERRAIVDGAEESLRHGVTCVGDISRTAIHVAGLRDLPLRAVCFCELINGARQKPATVPELEGLLDRLADSEIPDRLILGVSPHAPYTVMPGDLAACNQLAMARGCPLTIHALETEEERDWMLGRDSLLCDLLAERGLPTASIRTNVGVLAWLADAGLLRPGVLLAHVNYPDDADIRRLAASGVDVAWCPRAHAYYGHANHRWRDMLRAGINVCVGTDSAPASGTLSILDELRFIRSLAPEVGAGDILALGTWRGARALRQGDRIGTLTPRKLADFVAIPWNASGPKEPVEHVLSHSASPNGVWIGGVRVDSAV